MNFHSPAAQAELRSYNESMEKSLDDKLFFLDHTAGAMTFVDFGCANGAVLKAISERRYGKTLVGIDNNPFQLAIAAEKVSKGVFATSFEEVREFIEKAEGPKVAIFSSVLHEDTEIFKEPALSGLFDYIVVRDMGITENTNEVKVPQSWVDAVIANSPVSTDLAWNASGKPFWGKSIRHFTEFLLKYPYLGGDEVATARELSEQYPLEGIESLMEPVPTSATPYVPTHFEHYSAPWVVDRIRQDFGFEFPFPTHFKMILKKVAL